MPLVEFTVDDSLRIVSCNDELRKTRVGLSGALLGAFYYDVLPRILHEDCDAVMLVLKTGEALSLDDYRFGCPFEAFNAMVRISPLDNEQQEVIGAKVRVEGFTGCTLSSQLEQSQHLIDIGKVASILSHGVRNPLNAIKGAVVYLKGRYGHEANLVEFTDIMEDEISRLDKFITGFLSTSFYDFEQSLVDINTLLGKLELFVSMQADAAGVSIDFSYGEVVPLRLNPFQVEHAILNVLNNAILALPRGGGISVHSCLEELGGRRNVIVEIEDNGPGMPEGAVKGFEIPQVETALAKGKGFGLFITREIMQKHGGSLEVKTVGGKGTVVRLCLPAAGDGELPVRSEE
ncbi:two-component sensor histidine kinase [Desulfuromonas versatilis]|uniref:histidine kinase n=1 Tax=Desulfuromonas versatilis TaxID=2802975 RepID=A0ABN6DZ04_9BACT|nr:PAS domain-containing sensor histidine kinase [Desulfuromonas versatilis]BCR05295.1 two-component sensor histidine kinase [Desulfuromonas versatilis]